MAFTITGWLLKYWSVEVYWVLYQVLKICGLKKKNIINVIHKLFMKNVSRKFYYKKQ